MLPRAGAAGFQLFNLLMDEVLSCHHRLAVSIDRVFSECFFVFSVLLILSSESAISERSLASVCRRLMLPLLQGEANSLSNF